MKSYSKLGISKCTVNTFEGCKKIFTDDTNTKWYDILMTDEYQYNGKTLHQSHLLVECINPDKINGCHALTQAMIKGTGPKAQCDATNQIIECIQMLEEYPDKGYINSEEYKKLIG